MRHVLEAVGLQSPEGARIQRILKQDLAFYFRRLRRAVEDIGLEQLVLQYGPQPGDADGGERAATQNEVNLGRDVAAHTVKPVVDGLTELLFNILLLSLDSAMRAGLKQGEQVELNEAGEMIWLREQAIETFEVPGPAALAASQFAAQRAAQLVTGINLQTQQRMAQLIARGIRDKLGVEGTGRLIRRELLDMSVRRSNLIATTEINDAMSEAMLQKMQARNAPGKTTVLSRINPCPVCINNHQAGAMPIDQAFPSGHQRPPFHPDCHCTLVTKRLRR
jgi:hypothetical protein